jgi:hypothetical protein
MKGHLDDAYELAAKLHTTLCEATAEAEDHYAPGATYRRLGELTDAADDLMSRIDNQRTALTGGE